ncbi:MAG: hypothetical protein M1834_006137 [Cirrosporium novae-zelandiae]|nr:MAG: hypothetical protein M1834_006137 [Cirrosporium novae-zelandiae]
MSEENQTQPTDESIPENSGPDWRSHISRKKDKNAANYVTLYNKGDQVWLKGARSLQGPYTISAVHGDRTYQLVDDYGMICKDGVREKDLKLR